MSNYVYNRVRCFLETAIDLHENHLDWGFGMYEPSQRPYDSERVEFFFQTRGMEYYTEEIKNFIEAHKETEWFCIEENMIEQGYFYWDGSDVRLKMRDLNQFWKGQYLRQEIDTDHYDPIREIIFFEDGRIILEDYHANAMQMVTVPTEYAKELQESLKPYAYMLSREEYVLPPREDKLRISLNIFGGPYEGSIESLNPGDYWYGGVWKKKDSLPARNGHTLCQEITDRANMLLDEVNAGFRLTEDWGPILPQVDLRNSAINCQL